MAAIQTARERARADITAQITAAARRQLAVDGAPGLSLRAVARELGMVSSAVYRYVANRDELLTMLIVEAYDSLGDAVEATLVGAAGAPPFERFVAAATAVREWAIAHPHEYALVYGSPVPGYAAPETTIAPATRVTLALIGIIDHAHRAGLLEPPNGAVADVDRGVAADFEAVRDAVGAELPDDVLVRVIAAWTQLFGFVSFEVFGQTRNVIHHHAELFEATVGAVARLVGLVPTRSAAT